MSSYFDRMGRCMLDPVEVLNLVHDQFNWYLRKLADEVLAKDSEKLWKFIIEFDKIWDDKSLINEDPISVLSRFHSLAHRLAQANIRLKGGRRATDNPPIAY